MGETAITLLTILLLLVSFSFPVLAEEPRVYTDQDLEKYATGSTYDRETIIRRDMALKQWEKEKQIEEELIKNEKEAEERQEALKKIEATGQTGDSGTKSTHRIKKGKP